MLEILLPRDELDHSAIAKIQKDIYQFLCISSSDCVVTPFGLLVDIFSAANSSAEAKPPDIYYANLNAAEPWKELIHPFGKSSAKISFDSFVLNIQRNLHELKEGLVDLLLGYRQWDSEVFNLERIRDTYSYTESYLSFSFCLICVCMCLSVSLSLSLLSLSLLSLSS
jgi:hypothetical protein